MAPLLGLILTSAPDLPAVQSACAALRADILKVIPAWGLAGGWTPPTIAAAARIAPQLVVRTSWGDPSYAGGARALPVAASIVAELQPWLDARPDAWVEVGNEPLLADQDDELTAWEYAWHLDQAITAIRARWPRARLIGPAHIRNHPIRLAQHADGQARWDAISAGALRRCDALGLHAYAPEQAVRGLHQLRQVVSAQLPVWLTEFALNEALPPTVRAARYRQVLAEIPVAAALLYHLNREGGDVTSPHFNPNYDLDDATLAALGASAPAGDPDTAHYPAARVEGFALDVRQWRTVAAFRRHLGAHRYQDTAPWAAGCTIHHTVVPTLEQWRGLASMLSMARYYRAQRWSSGPHLFVASGAPDPADDGIWQLTPLSMRGTHGNACNAGRWGVEVVGRYDRERWDAGTSGLALGALAALHDWAGWPAVSAATLNGHRDCRGVDPGKTCPGAAIDLAAVRRGVAALR